MTLQSNLTVGAVPADLSADPTVGAPGADLFNQLFSMLVAEPAAQGAGAEGTALPAPPAAIVSFLPAAPGTPTESAAPEGEGTEAPRPDVVQDGNQEEAMAVLAGLFAVLPALTPVAAAPVAAESKPAPADTTASIEAPVPGMAQALPGAPDAPTDATAQQPFKIKDIAEDKGISSDIGEEVQPQNKDASAKVDTPAMAQAAKRQEGQTVSLAHAVALSVAPGSRSAKPAAAASEHMAPSPTLNLDAPLAQILGAEGGRPSSLETVTTAEIPAFEMLGRDEMAVERQLDLAQDGEWLDQLAKDIAQTCGKDGQLRFRLNPETLGTLKVEVSHGHAGTTVRLTADTEAARNAIADAQPRLLAEARAQGVRIAETHVDLGNGQGGASADPRRQQDNGNPHLRTARSDVRAEDQSDREAAPGGSDRYA